MFPAAVVARKEKKLRVLCVCELCKLHVEVISNPKLLFPLLARIARHNQEEGHA